MRTLIRHPFFWVLTLMGNSAILAGSLSLYHFEKVQNGAEIGYLDCLLWSTGTVTTVGYGSYMAETFPGKLTVLSLMLFGTLFVWSYMGFLVSGLITPEMNSLEREIHEMERELESFKALKKNRTHS